MYSSSYFLKFNLEINDGDSDQTTEYILCFFPATTSSFQKPENSLNTGLFILPVHLPSVYQPTTCNKM